MKTWRISFVILIIFTALTGIFYPLFVTGLGQAFMAKKAAGSLIHNNEGVIIGSELIGQAFTDPKYFWPRPSATGYNALPSGGSNLGLTNADLQAKVSERQRQYGTSNVPADLLFASGSGLDPHISPSAAYFQVGRIVKQRNLNAMQKVKLVQLVEDFTEAPDFHIFGQEHVNVLKLNLALDTTF